MEDYCKSYRRITTRTYFDHNSGINDVYYFSRELEAEYPRYEKAEYSGCIELESDFELAKRLEKVITISKRDLEEQSLNRRLVDAYGMFELLLHREREYEKAEALKVKNAKKQELAQAQAQAQAPQVQAGAAPAKAQAKPAPAQTAQQS